MDGGQYFILKIMESQGEELGRLKKQKVTISMVLRISLFKKEILFLCLFLSVKFLLSSESTDVFNSYLLSIYYVPVIVVGT